MAVSKSQSEKSRVQFWVKLILGGIVVIAVVEILVGLLQAFAILPG